MIGASGTGKPLNVLIETVENMPLSYHNGLGDSRRVKIPNSNRRFIAWDGEGMNLNGEDQPQSYVLFGASTGDIITGELKTKQILDFIVEVGQRHPGAWHVGFAFTYDANMIVKSLSVQGLKALYRQKYLHIGNYCLTLRPGKSLRVTRYGKNYDRKRNPHDKVTVTIYDIFSFFGKSFVASVEEYLGADAVGLDLVKEGKQQRGSFTDIGYVEKYWRAEIELLEQLANELRTRMYGAGLEITQWYGPGALGSYALKQNGVKRHLATHDDKIREAARYGYAGGRFELFKVGRVEGPVYSLDINSAYPYAISQLPSFADGSWHYIQHPKRVAKFGIYHIRLRARSSFTKNPGPLFHRDKQHNISFPWITEGWYWSPEVAGLIGSKYEGLEILEGYEWHSNTNEKPFDWVHGMYEQRQQWKAEGNPSQIALKLCLNSMYGKMAQRVGWDKKKDRIPPWHQLEWAGWTTSYTRAMLYKVMRRIPFEHLVAVETDGIYTTMSPSEVGITTSTELGGWEVTQYEEAIYIQSGLAFLRDSRGEWHSKYRGLDKDSFTVEDAQRYVATLAPNAKWEPYQARLTRFVGLGAAIMTEASTPIKQRHCRWETTDRLIIPGEQGKRVHIPTSCQACKDGLSADVAAHDLVIMSKSKIGIPSQQHLIPWENRDDEEAWWRDAKEYSGSMIEIGDLL